MKGGDLEVGIRVEEILVFSQYSKTQVVFFNFKLDRTWNLPEKKK